MTRLERVAARRERAWYRWRMLRAMPRGVAERAWSWVMRWDEAYHDVVMTDFLDKNA